MTNIEQSYQNTTHKVNLTGGEISTILYYLDEVSSKWVGKHDEDSLRGKVDRIYAELQSVTDSYYAYQEQLELTKQRKLETQNENNYAECVDHLVNTMGGN